MKIKPQWEPGERIRNSRKVPVLLLFGLYPKDYQRTKPLLRLCEGPATLQDLAASLGERFHRNGYSDAADYVLRRALPSFKRDLPEVGLHVCLEGDEYVLSKSTENPQNPDPHLTTAQAIQRVKRKNVIAALKRVDREGVPEKRRSSRYCLIEGEKHYPPMWVLKLACQEAGTPIGKSHGREFFGGEQTNKPLRDLGFTVVICPDVGKHADVVDYLRTIDSLDAPRQQLARKEQAFLRRRLLDGLDKGPCAICGETYPIALLVVAHIKKRCECSESEKRDMTNIVPMCLFGCDALFERGYIGVPDRQMVSIPGLETTEVVERRIKELAGRTCTQWTDENAPYFKWHHAQAIKKHGRLATTQRATN